MKFIRWDAPVSELSITLGNYNNTNTFQTVFPPAAWDVVTQQAQYVTFFIVIYFCLKEYNLYSQKNYGIICQKKKACWFYNFSECLKPPKLRHHPLANFLANNSSMFSLYADDLSSAKNSSLSDFLTSMVYS